MYEHRKRPILAHVEFAKRMLLHGVASFVLMFVSLGIGVLGYHFLGGFGWVDSLLNASMILGGMGPVDPLHNDAAKIFASFYALFSGVIFLVVVGIILAPMAHRILHYLHLEEDESLIRDKRLDQLVSKE
jgi:hypothetical protein